MDKIIVTEGIANQVKGCLNMPYDYLDKCDTAIDNCKLLDELGIPNSGNALKVVIFKQKNSIGTLLGNVSIFEENILELDNEKSNEINTNIDTKDSDDVVNADIVETVISAKDDTISSTQESTQDTSNKTTVKTTVLTLEDENEETENNNEFVDTSSQDNIYIVNNNSGNSNNNTSNYGNNSNEFTNNYSGGNTSYDNNNNSSNNEVYVDNGLNYYEFSTELQDMINNGDPFANSPYSLTSYTNFLLYKYNVKDESIAKKIYKAMIEYGKNYSLKNNGVNPTLNQDENLIIMGLYNILKQDVDFDINKYSIFQNIQITNS